MGEVYAAHDPELDRRVAIKILRADARPDTHRSGAPRARGAGGRQAVAPERRGDLRRRIIGRTDVPGDGAGRGGDAGGLARASHPHDRARSSPCSRWPGAASAAAHRAGIVHRDFKPQNVMVARDGSARVMDFGLAAAGGPGHTPQVRLTKAGAILGTPLYMSPEQMVGQAVDPRADQFSFCVALWEALHGARPFEGSTVLELRGDVLAGRPRPGPLAKPRSPTDPGRAPARALRRSDAPLPGHGRAPRRAHRRADRGADAHRRCRRGAGAGAGGIARGRRRLARAGPQGGRLRSGSEAGERLGDDGRRADAPRDADRLPERRQRRPRRARALRSRQPAPRRIRQRMGERLARELARRPAARRTARRGCA